MEEQFALLEKNFQQEPYLSVQQRKELLHSLAKLLQKNVAAITAAINQDFGYRSADETFTLEIVPNLSAIDYCLKQLKHWVQPRKRRLPWYFTGAKAYVFPQPLGIVGVMVPWNYPLFLAIGPTIFALAAGNRVMIKMSEQSMHLGKLLEQLIANSPLLSQHIVVINGDLSIAQQFSSLPFAHLLFTGSTQVGKLVMEAASKNLTPVTLELGGKSPVIVSKTARPALFERIFIGKLFNAGQTCLASDYLLIPEGWEQLIETKFSQFMAKRYPNVMTNESYTSIISPNSRASLLALIEDARAKGGRIVQFGEESTASTHHKMPVYLIFNATRDMEVMKKEIFGPILPIITYQSMDEVVHLVNSMSKPLALYYFGQDEKEKKRMIEELLSGATSINDTLSHVAIHDLPFGGVQYSGMGEYHGQEGFDRFSKLKAVFEQSRFSAMSLIYPPVGKMAKALLSYISGIKK